MSGGADPRGGGARGIVAFDNSGTVSDALVEAVGFTDDADFDGPVPTVRADRPAALVNVEIARLAVLDTDAPLGTVLADVAARTYLALSNVETTASAARRATLADDVAPARPLFDAAERLRERAAAEHGLEEVPIGVQLVVEPGSGPEDGRIHRGFVYASVPRPEARSVLEDARERGFDVHLVSGDAAHVLEAVAAQVGVPAGNVHAYQSPEGKAETVSALRERNGGPVVMVGDYVNDRLAFERADRAVLVCAEGEPDPTLARPVDAVAGSLPDVLARL